MTITRYRKLPVEVDTIQWTGDNETNVQTFTGGASRFYALDAEDREGSDDPEATATVYDELHSTWVLVYTGQHIVRGVKGEFYPIAEDVLAETYERVKFGQASADARALALYEQWVKAGPPPLGASMARWWDARLVEFHSAILSPAKRQAGLRPLVDTVDESQRHAEIADDVTAHTKELMARRTTTLRERAERAEGERDGAYRERAHLVALLAAMTDGAVITPAPDVDEPGWQIVYLTLGGRQASWHISPRDADLFQHVERVEPDDPRAQWDGHATQQKYAGIAAWTAELAQRCGPACAEQHTETGRCEITRNR